MVLFNFLFACFKWVSIQRSQFTPKVCQPFFSSGTLLCGWHVVGSQCDFLFLSSVLCSEFQTLVSSSFFHQRAPWILVATEVKKCLTPKKFKLSVCSRNVLHQCSFLKDFSFEDLETSLPRTRQRNMSSHQIVILKSLSFPKHQFWMSSRQLNFLQQFSKLTSQSTCSSP